MKKKQYKKQFKALKSYLFISRKNLVKIVNYLNPLLEVRTIHHHENRAQMSYLANILKPRLLDTKYFHCELLAIKFMPLLVIYFFRL